MEFEIGVFTKHTNASAKSLYDWEKTIIAFSRQKNLNEYSGLLEFIVLQMISVCPANAYELYLYDPKAGNSYPFLKNLLATTSNEIGEQIFSERDAIKKIEEINKVVLQRYSLLAAAGAKSIYELNRNSKKPQALIFFMLAGLEDVLFGDSGSFGYIKNIIEQGSKVGVFIILDVHEDGIENVKYSDQQKERFYDYMSEFKDKFYGFSSGLKHVHFGGDSRYLKILEDFGYLPIVSDAVKNRFFSAIVAKRSSAIENNIDKNVIEVKIGESQTKPIFFSIGNLSNCFYALVSGGARSGKSFFLMGLVLQICEKYNPKDVELILIDYQEVTFLPFRNKFKHINCVFTEQGVPSDFLSPRKIISYVVKEMERRVSLFSDATQKYHKIITKIDDYNSISLHKLPSIIILIDELQAITLAKDRSFINEFWAFLNNIASKGAKAGIYIVLATQSFSTIHSEIDGYYSNSRLRIGLRPNKDRDFYAIMGQHNDGYRDIKKREAIFNSDSGDPASNILVELNETPVDQIQERIDLLAKKYPKNQPSELEKILMLNDENLVGLSKSSEISSIENQGNNSAPSWF